LVPGRRASGQSTPSGSATSIDGFEGIRGETRALAREGIADPLRHDRACGVKRGTTLRKSVLSKLVVSLQGLNRRPDPVALARSFAWQGGH
jgi:hypothetical protein